MKQSEVVQSFIDYVLDNLFIKGDGFYLFGTNPETYEFSMTFTDGTERVYTMYKDAFTENLDNIDRMRMLTSLARYGHYRELVPTI